MGMVINLGTSNAPVQTSSKVMGQVQPDTTAAELGALSIASKEIIWWSNMLQSIGLIVEVDKPIPVQQDNTSTIIISQRGPGFGKSRYLNVAYFYVKQFQSPSNEGIQEVYRNNAKSSKLILKRFG